MCGTTAKARTLSLEIEGVAGVAYETHFIGILPRSRHNQSTDARQRRKAARRRENRESPSRQPQISSDVGQVLAKVSGLSPKYQLTGKELYVRAVVVSSETPTDPSWEGQKQQAWTQPVGWEWLRKKLPNLNILQKHMQF